MHPSEVINIVAEIEHNAIEFGKAQKDALRQSPVQRASWHAQYEDRRLVLLKELGDLLLVAR